jgi:Tfp pilus assembly protein FimT
MLLALLLAAGAGGAVLRLGGSDERPPLAAKARGIFGKAKHITLEQVADYWLASDHRKKGGPVLGSGTALALAIRLGRAEAVRSGVKPVPRELKRAFKKHYPDKVLDGARWTVADPDSRLGRVLARWPVQQGAVTLGDVVVFKTKRAAKNRQLFAHELVHVDQYRKLGINMFARRYAADPDPIEEEARTKARRVVRSS